MAGFRLQILGQYHGLLRNFCDRSQRVSPFWMVYSSGAPATGLMSDAGAGRGLCSVTTGAFSGGFFAGTASSSRVTGRSCPTRSLTRDAALGGCPAWGATGGGG